MRRVIRVSVTLDYKLSAHVAIEDDGTSTADVGNWWVTMDDLGTKTQTKVHITGWPRKERTGVALIAEAFKQLADVENEVKIP